MKTTAKFIAAADLHLNLNMWTNNKAIAYDSLFSLYNILSLADHLKLPVIFAGDTFDTKMISSELFSHVLEIRKAFPNVDIYYVNGNHDCLSPSWLAHLPGNVVKLGKDPVVVNGKTVAGLDYQLVADFEPALKEVYPYADVLVTHQTYSCFFNTAASIDYNLLANRKTVISGDYHKTMEYYFQVDTPTNVISPGSASKCTVSEPYPRVLLMYDDDYHDNGLMLHNVVNLPHRSFSYISDIQKVIPANYKTQDLIDAASKYSITDKYTITQKTNVTTTSDTDAPVRLCYFYELMHKAQSTQRDPMLYNVYIATDKEQVKLGNELINAVGNGYVLYSPIMVPPMAQDEADHHEGGTMYLEGMLNSYPLDPAVKAAAAEFIFGDSKSFLTKEEERFGCHQQ